eukprot:GDKI01002166.1.p3 GENE.GDKI01002166.1~~GDKI01002166.1.p3  ORF type:complete len:102 (-),score=39.71 GDKI01002166.1:152-457(-)
MYTRPHMHTPEHKLMHTHTSHIHTHTTKGGVRAIRGRKGEETEGRGRKQNEHTPNEHTHKTHTRTERTHTPVNTHTKRTHIRQCRAKIGTCVSMCVYIVDQ